MLEDLEVLDMSGCKVLERMKPGVPNYVVVTIPTEQLLMELRIRARNAQTPQDLSIIVKDVSAGSLLKELTIRVRQFFTAK